MKDVTFFGYGILALSLAFFASLFLLLVALSVISWAKQWRYLKWGAPLAAAGIAVALALVVAEPVEFLGGNEFPYLHTVPDATELPGTYVLDPSCVGRLKDEGYDALSTTMVVRSDGTFEIASMPHTWVALDKKGHDWCVGHWMIEKKPESDVYGLVFAPGSFSPASAYSADPYFRNRPIAPVFVGISDKTKARKDYALAVRVSTGDGDGTYLVFVKKKAANPLPGTIPGPAPGRGPS